MLYVATSLPRHEPVRDDHTYFRILSRVFICTHLIHAHPGPRTTPMSVLSLPDQVPQLLRADVRRSSTLFIVYFLVLKPTLIVLELTLPHGVHPLLSYCPQPISSLFANSSTPHWFRPHSFYSRLLRHGNRITDYILETSAPVHPLYITLSR